MKKPKVNKNTLSNFYTDVKPMFFASIFTQAIGFVANLFLAKIYGENAYGIFGTFLSISAIGAVVFTLQFENNIITQQHKKTQWYNATWFLCLINTLIIFLVTYGSSLVIPFDNYTIIFIGILGGLLLSLITTNENLLAATNNFNKIAIVKTIVTLLTICFQYGLYVYYTSTGLIYGTVIAFFIGTICYFVLNRLAVKKINYTFIKKAFSKENTLLTFLLPSNILNSIGIHGIPILILLYFDAKQAGVYFLSTKILGAPLQLLTNSISKVYFQQASKLYVKNSYELFCLTKKVITRNATLIITCLIAINTFGIYILELFFSKNWENLRLFTLIVSFLIACRALFNPVSSIIVVTNKNEISLKFNIYLIVCNILAISIGYYFKNITITIIVLSIMGGLGYVYLTYYFVKFLKQLHNV